MKRPYEGIAGPVPGDPGPEHAKRGRLDPGIVLARRMRSNMSRLDVAQMPPAPPSAAAWQAADGDLRAVCAHCGVVRHWCMPCSFCRALVCPECVRECRHCMDFFCPCCSTIVDGPDEELSCCLDCRDNVQAVMRVRPPDVAGAQLAGGFCSGPATVSTFL
jgi:hypothetical protein